MPNDDTHLICPPTRGIAKPPIPGAVKRVCVRCRCQVWTAPSGLRIQRERKAVLLCIPCFLADPEFDKTIEQVPTSAQEREIAAALKENKK